MSQLLRGKTPDVTFWAHQILSAIFLCISLFQPVGLYILVGLQLCALAIVALTWQERREVAQSLLLGIAILVPAVVAVLFVFGPLLRAVAALG
ncbi:MAG TPA: hypothetical protein VM409_07475 [Chloroflexia bacterium]|nr:hypothetical protein [Chloroflexia bacterium]